MAQRINRDTDELLEEAVEHLVAYNEWFEEKVRIGIAAFHGGEVVSDEQVRDWVENGNLKTALTERSAMQVEW